MAYRWVCSVPMGALVLALAWAGTGPPARAGQKKDPARPAADLKKIAEAIGKGHSYQKHVVDEENFPEVKTREEFIQLIGKVLARPTHARKLTNDREAFYDQRTNTIVIVNPHARDRGTCFRPNNGKRYYDNLK